MKKVKFLFFVSLLIVGMGLNAQTVDEVINKHIDAIGGKANLNQVKSLTLDITMDVMGTSAPVTEYLLNGKGFKTEAEFNGQKIITAYTDQSGWTINPLAGGNDPQALPDAVYKGGRDQIFVGGSLLDYAAKGYKAELEGKEGGAYKVKVTKDGSESHYLIDSSTYYITKSVTNGEMMGSPVEVTITFSDHKKTDFGIVLPYSNVVDLGGFSFSSKVNKVEANKEIDPKIFEMPK
jgi:hypothetical protein